jgi:hypothetical protein
VICVLLCAYVIIIELNVCLLVLFIKLFEAVLNSNVSVGSMDGSNIPFDSMDEDSEQEFDDEINLILVVLEISDDNENTKMLARNLPL